MALNNLNIWKFPLFSAKKLFGGEIKLGAWFIEKSYASFTKNVLVADNFASQNKSQEMCFFRIPKGIKVANIDINKNIIAQYQEESEVLLEQNNIFTVSYIFETLNPVDNKMITYVGLDVTKVN